MYVRCACICVCFPRFTRYAVQNCVVSTHQSSTSSSSSRTFKRRTYNHSRRRFGQQKSMLRKAIYPFRFVCVLCWQVQLQFSVEFLMDKYGRIEYSQLDIRVLRPSACISTEWTRKLVPHKAPRIFSHFFCPLLSQKMFSFVLLSEKKCGTQMAWFLPIYLHRLVCVYGVDSARIFAPPKSHRSSKTEEIPSFCLLLLFWQIWQSVCVCAPVISYSSLCAMQVNAKKQKIH